MHDFPPQSPASYGQPWAVCGKPPLNFGGGAKSPPTPPPNPATPDPDEQGAADMEMLSQRRKKSIEQAQQGTLLSGLARRITTGPSSFQAGPANKPSRTEQFGSLRFGAGNVNIPINGGQA